MYSSRQLAAIMFTDIVGYTALMERDEQKAFEFLRINRQIQLPLIKQHNGKWIKELGDGVLASFSTTTDAVLCAHAIQQSCAQIPGLKLRIGIHQGEVVFENGDVFGDGVNLASRLQGVASPGEIVVSEAVYTNIKNKFGIKAAFLGEKTLKNVAFPVRVFQINSIGEEAVQPITALDTKKTTKKRENITLKKLILSLFVLASLTGIGLFHFLKNNTPDKVVKLDTPLSTDNSIVVLPFVNMSNDPAQDYFADGIMDEILNHLFKIGGWRIISRTSAMAYKGTKKTVRDIAKELGVANLLEGSVQKEGQRIRIRVQLINARTDEHLWAETYDRDFKDVFAIQSNIAENVASELKVNIEPEVKRRIEYVPTTNTEAYSFLMRAAEDLYSSKGTTHTRKLIEQAIALDSTYADAYAWLAIYWLNQGGWNGNIERKEVIEKAEPLLQRTLQLNPDVVVGHVGNMMLELWCNWNFKAVEQAYKKVIQLNPSNTQFIITFSNFLIAIGRHQEALKNSLYAFKHDKNVPETWVFLADDYYFNNMPDKAEETISTAASLFSSADIFLVYLLIKVHVGKFKDAVDFFERKYSSIDSSLEPTILAFSGIAYYKTGQKDKAEKALAILKAKSEHSSVGSPSYSIAAIYTAIGQSDMAIQWLEKAYREHEVEMYMLKVAPEFQPLHNNPRFQNIVNRIGYPK